MPVSRPTGSLVVNDQLGNLRASNPSDRGVAFAARIALTPPDYTGHACWDRAHGYLLAFADHWGKASGPSPAGGGRRS